MHSESSYVAQLAPATSSSLAHACSLGTNTRAELDDSMGGNTNLALDVCDIDMVLNGSRITCVLLAFAPQTVLEQDHHPLTTWVDYVNRFPAQKEVVDSVSCVRERLQPDCGQSSSLLLNYIEVRAVENLQMSFIETQSGLFDLIVNLQRVAVIDKLGLNLTNISERSSIELSKKLRRRMGTRSLFMSRCREHTSDQRCHHHDVKLPHTIPRTSEDCQISSVW